VVTPLAIEGRDDSVRGAVRRRDRVLSWLITGPLGHLAAGLVDWIVMVARHQRARLRR
jgi:hypothetical protein